mmetsp:Transcript_9487/g.21758  ORF Transcript_9487/g.21758 Transcript_9487/m.21758 type:complete len:296 (-) Transcript_9487:953-1840(-)
MAGTAIPARFASTLSAKRCRSHPCPSSACLAMEECIETADLKASSRSARVEGRENVWHMALAWTVHDRIVSVLPCLKAEVFALSYVEAAWPCMCQCASWKSIWNVPSTADFLEWMKVGDISGHSCAATSSVANTLSVSSHALLMSRATCSSSNSTRFGPSAAVTGSAGAVLTLSANISLTKRTTATPSPQECSNMTAALPVGVTMIWKLLSNHRLRPSPWSISRLRSTASVGVRSSRQTAKSAESTTASGLAFLGSSSSFARALAHVVRCAAVRAPSGSEADGGEDRMRWTAARI